MLPDKRAGQAATFTIPLVNMADEAIDATSVAWSLYGQDGVEITAGSVSSFTQGSPSATFTIPGEFMSLPDGVSFEGREIALTCTTASGEDEVRDVFILVNQHPVIPFKNSVVTYLEALALRREFGPVMDAWDGASDEERQRAIIHAYSNLSMLTFTLKLPPGSREQDYAAYGTGEDLIFDVSRSVRLSSITAETFATLSPAFRRAIKRAQMVEADTILGGDPVGKARSEGVISETVGESSTFFKSSPALNLPIGRRAFEILRPWLRIKVSVSRS